MLAKQDILSMVINKFPEQANRLTKLFHKDENFREVCEDYFLCHEAINKIIISNKKRGEILKEYEFAMKELEMEMLIYLNTESTENDN